MFQGYPQYKGTLAPGQTIAVNNYTVQVERYLSQGGFAHVYLVRTPTPVYNTTHHVLKRIAVSNETMLTEVKKEVDVMRLLKGHPNIVHFIDAAWHKLPNGSFEVFILMEYCPGGGIIDMMNRRLRERLTEAEILQIFVDVCEGVAFMHNSRPPLLHRDLKVENILQSSPTSFKLCDFGSAATVSNPPSGMQEIRALESDLNKHTTLQYRAPEMVDVYSKRPINQKSDVWALGVLLYKLCYYTTPFEEHGPLAILNVQYRTPPYPIYSQEMNILIASMLREHGAQRPTVFELLAQVHRLRGTKSKFSYTIPVIPPLIPRVSQPTKTPPVNNSLDGLAAYGSPSTKSAVSLYGPGSIISTTPPNHGIQARDKVLEAIAPMRRGRPIHGKEVISSRPPSPQNTAQESTAREARRSWMDVDFNKEHDQAWQSAKEKTQVSRNKDDAWAVNASPQVSRPENTRPAGFGDDFAEKLWSASDPNTTSVLKPKLSPRLNATSIAPKASESAALPTPLAYTGSRMLRPKQDRIIPNRDKERDAFDGLGLMTPSVKPVPTLGEARKLRTGLAIMGSTQASQGDWLRSTTEKPSTGSSPRPTRLSPMLQQQSVLPLLTQNSSNSSFRAPQLAYTEGLPSGNADGLPIESRFPSLEELDARFVSSAASLYPSFVNDANMKFTSQSKPSESRASQKLSRNNYIASPGTGGIHLRPNIISNVTYSRDNKRSELVAASTKESKDNRKQDERSNNDTKQGIVATPSHAPSSLTHQRRPSLLRKHRSSVSVKTSVFASPTPNKTQDNLVDNSSLLPPKVPARPPSDTLPRDWLTGDDHEKPSTSRPRTDVPVLRDSPSKRASFIAQSDFQIPASSTAQQIFTPERFVDEPQSADLSPSVSRLTRAFPDVETIDMQQVNIYTSNGLTDNWSPVRKEMETDLSSGDEGPEDPGALQTSHATPKRKDVPRVKERQSSVHDLVNQYGGGLLAKEKEPDPLLSQTPRAGDYASRKPQATGLTLPVKQELERTTPSPTRNLTKTGLVTPITGTKPHRQPSLAPQQNPPLATKPTLSTTTRSRPQSMFLFPSKSSDSSTSPSSALLNLMPPEDPHPRTPRRLSISDMVQKYEAIGGKNTSLPAGPPSPVRPVSAKGEPDGQKASSSEIPNQTPAVVEERSRLRSTSPSKSRATRNDSLKQNLSVGVPLSLQGKTHNRIVSDNRRPLSTKAEIISSPRKLSIKAAPTIITSSSRTDPLAAARAAKSAGRQEDSGQTASRSPRKRTTSIPPDVFMTTKADELRSPIEQEQTYQGVSKLIDQWQKKSEGVDQSRPLVSGKRSFTAKRIGTVPTGGS